MHIDSHDKEFGELNPVPTEGEVDRVRSHCQTTSCEINEWTRMCHTRAADKPYGINSKIDPVGWGAVNTLGMQ
jgi:hypothetical protein